MSDVSLIYEDFEEFSNYDHLDHVEGTLHQPLHVPELSDSRNNNEAKLYIDILSLDGLPSSPNKYGIYKNYTLQVELGSEKFKKHFSASSTNRSVYSVKEKEKISSVFSIVEFYGLSQMKFVLKTNSTFSGKKIVIGEQSVSLAELMNRQVNANYEEENNVLNKSWSISHSIVMETDLIIKPDAHHQNSASGTSWLETAKSAALSPSLVNGVSSGIVIRKFDKKFRHNQFSSISTSTSLRAAVRVAIHFQFRLVALKRCLQLNSVDVHIGYLKGINRHVSEHVSIAVSPLAPPHRMSELHGFLTTARPHEVIELLRSLAASQCLAQALRLQSSHGYTALDWALLAGNHLAVTEVLQRAGNLCFRDVVPGKRGPFHLAVHGGSKDCVDILWRFFKKYSGDNNSAVSFTTGSDHWSPTLFALLEWRDEDDNTPLLLACCLPNRSTALVEMLLFAGANISAVNHRTDLTPLMQACQVGAADVVRILLCIVKSSLEIDDTIFAVNSSVVSSTSTHDSALQRHLRANARSRNLLKGRDVSAGGHLNPLSLYCCLPTSKELSSGRQAVHIAAAEGHGEIVRMLLEIGVSCAETDRHGDNPFHLMARGGHSRACALVLQCERSQWKAHKSLVSERLLQTMQTRKRSLCCENYRGLSCVEVAVEGGHLALAKMLLEASVEIYGSSDMASCVSAVRLLDDLLACRQPPSVADDASPHSLSRRPVSVEREKTVVRSRSSSHADKVREKGVCQEEKEDEEDEEVESFEEGDVGARATPPNLSLRVPNVNEYAERLAALRVALISCKSPSSPSCSTREEGEGDAQARLQQLQEDDEADHQEYFFALSALAVRALGDSSAAASRST